VRDFEPVEALVDRGQTARLVDDARRVLDGALVLEVHEDRAQEVLGDVLRSGYTEGRVRRDLAGRERVVEARWGPTKR